MTGFWMWWLCHKIRKHHVWYLKVKLIIQEGKIYFIIRCHNQKRIFNVRIFFFLVNKNFLMCEFFLFLVNEVDVNRKHRCMRRRSRSVTRFMFWFVSLRRWRFFLLICKRFLNELVCFWLSFRRICFFLLHFLLQMKKIFWMGSKFKK